jgi:hypothetical protein
MICPSSADKGISFTRTFADAAKQHTIFRDCSDQLSGVKPIFILESDVLGKPKADSGPDNGYKKEFLVPYCLHFVRLSRPLFCFFYM